MNPFFSILKCIWLQFFQRWLPGHDFKYKLPHFYPVGTVLFILHGISSHLLTYNDKDLGEFPHWIFFLFSWLGKWQSFPHQNSQKVSDPLCQVPVSLPPLTMKRGALIYNDMILNMFAIWKTWTMALSTLNRILSLVSLVILAILHSSFVADSVSVNKEAETYALLNWKTSLQNET